MDTPAPTPNSTPNSTPNLTPNLTPEPTPEPNGEPSQKLIRKITRLAAVGFLAIGVLVLVTGGDIILGAAFTLIGLAELVLFPHILEKIITTKLNQRNDKGE